MAAPGPHVEILFPYLGKVIPLARVGDYEVRLRVTQWSGRVQLALDEFRPVVIDDPTQRIPLRDLVPADRELAAGSHRLFAVAIDEQGRMLRARVQRSQAPFAVVNFRVGSRVPVVADRPFLVYSQPRGTFNGDQAAEDIFVDYYQVGTEGLAGSRVRVSVSGSGVRASHVLTDWQPLALHGLPSGDFVVQLTLVDDHGARIGDVAAVARTITVNRDAPLPPAGDAVEP